MATDGTSITTWLPNQLGATLETMELIMEVLDENISVILKITMLMPRNSPLTMSALQQVNSGNVKKINKRCNQDNKQSKQQEDPRDNKTQSGR